MCWARWLSKILHTGASARLLVSDVPSATASSMIRLSSFLGGRGHIIIVCIYVYIYIYIYMFVLIFTYVFMYIKTIFILRRLGDAVWTYSGFCIRTHAVEETEGFGAEDKRGSRR